MKCLVSGAGGLIGSSLVASLTAGGHQVTRLTRAGSEAGSIAWDPATGVQDRDALEGHDAVVHLAGENIAGRWTAAKKRRIADSRIIGTRSLCAALAALQRPPNVLVCASAIGYYGDRGDEMLDERSPAGTGFLAETCRAWEEAAEGARGRGIRVVPLRFGVVLSRRGGALARMLTPFRLGLGGRIGDGSQYMSWVAIDDAVGALEHALAREDLSGPVNAVSPAPVTNREFTATLARVLSRPAVFPMPAAAARLVFGEMADALLLASARVTPARLLATGYPFRHPALEGALRHAVQETR
jgi:uncharacterized protein (TIGR01777 family)